MSESLPPEKGANDRAFGVACWTLGGLAFVLLLMVGVSFSLSVRLKVRCRISPDASITQ